MGTRHLDRLAAITTAPVHPRADVEEAVALAAAHIADLRARILAARSRLAELEARADALSTVQADLGAMLLETFQLLRDERRRAERRVEVLADAVAARTDPRQGAPAPVIDLSLRGAAAVTTSPLRPAAHPVAI